MRLLLKKTSRGFKRFIITLYTTCLLLLFFFASPLLLVNQVNAANQPIRVLFTSEPHARLAYYLNYYNIPYDVVTSFTADDVVGNYTTIAVVGAGGGLVDNALEQTIKTLVQDHGIGLTYCGWTSTTYSTHDPTIVSIFNVDVAEYLGSFSSAPITVTDSSHFITQNYENYPYLYPENIGSNIDITSYTPNGVYPKFLATQDISGKEMLIVNTFGEGRAAWFNFNCGAGVNSFNQGLIAGAFLRSLIWTSEPSIGQHFAYSTIPSYFTMRVDDVEGDFEPMFSISEANGLKLSSMLFTDAVRDNSSYLSRLQQYYNKNHGMGVHARDNTDSGHFFWSSSGITEPDLTNGFNEFRDLFTSWQFRQPSTFVPSQYRINNSVFSVLESRGLHYYWGFCGSTQDGASSTEGNPYGDFTTTKMDVWVSSLSSDVWCFNHRRPGGESLTNASSMAINVDNDKRTIEWAIRNQLPIILYTHEYFWQNFSESQLNTWAESIKSYLDDTISGWSSLAGEFLAPTIVEHKNISVTDAQFDSVNNKYEITVDGTNALPVPVTIYEPNNNIKGWDGTSQIIQNGDFYYLYIPAGSGSRTFTVALDAGTPSNGFGYVYKVDTLIESTTTDGLGLKVDLYDFGTVDLKGYGGKVTRGTTTIQSDDSFIGSVTFSDGSEQWALVPMTIKPTGGSIDVVVEAWHSDGDRYKKWVATSSAGVTTDHVVGDLGADQSYQVKVDGSVYTTVTADGSGQISFNYSGGYSTKTFEVIKYTAPIATPAVTTGSPTPAPASPPTCDAATPSSAPWLYGASAKGSKSILLQFSEAGDPVSEYVVEYGTESGNYRFAMANIGGKGATSYLVNGLSPNTAYYFRVRAGNGCATGKWSNELSAKTYSDFAAAGGSLSTEIIEAEMKQREVAEAEEKDEDGTTEPVLEERVLGVSVKIKVVNEDKKPVPGVKVTLYSTPREATTNQDGIALFEGVEPGEHRAVIAFNGQTGEQKINVPENGDVDEIDFTIQIRETSPFTNPWVIGVIAAVSLAFSGTSVAAYRWRRTKSDRD